MHAESPIPASSLVCAQAGTMERTRFVGLNLYVFACMAACVIY